MNKHIVSALCLTLIATALPGCRNRKNETPQEVIIEENETIDTATMLELDKRVFEEEGTEATVIRTKG